MEELFYGGDWWRFSEYELKDGYVRPVPGARSERYSPYEEFQAIRSDRKERDAPYQVLLRLVDRLRFDADAQLTEESQMALLDWCTRYGLLGSLLHQVQAVKFAGRERRLKRPVPPHGAESGRQQSDEILTSRDAETAKRGKASREHREQKPTLFHTRQTYQRTSYGSWKFGDVQMLHPAVRAKFNQEGRLVSGKEWTDSDHDVLRMDLQTGEWGFEPLTQTWARFFPDVPERQRATYQYPAPYSETFWRMYAEPLHEFRAAALIFKEAFWSALLFRDPEQRTPSDQRVEVTTSKLNALVAPVGPALLKMRDGAFEQRIMSPSLLGTLALMAQQDLASSRRVIRCRNEKCRLIVVAFRYQTRYCSRQCRFVAEKRAQRAKEKGGHKPKKHERRSMRNARRKRR